MRPPRGCRWASVPEVEAQGAPTMSEISNNNPLRQFHEVAKQGLDGEVRLSRDDPNPLVNKGSLGSRISTFFDTIGRALGPVSDDRKERQQQALEGFREGLRTQSEEMNSETALRGPSGRTLGRSTG